MSAPETMATVVTSKTTVTPTAGAEVEVMTYANGITSLHLTMTDADGIHTASAWLRRDEVAALIKALAPGLAG